MIKTRITILSAIALVVGGLLGGCKTHSLSPYVSPRVEGRVVEAGSHQPIEGVRVVRLSSDESDNIMEPPKGGEKLKKPAPVRTAGDGTFVLDSQRDVVVFLKREWYSVTLSFRHSAYEGFTVTYTVADATNTATHEPLVKAGDILLIPRRK